MISQAVKVQRLIDNERKKLLDENTPPAAGAARALRLFQSPRHERPDAADMRAGRRRSRGR
jgi:hypothetical protein